MMGGMVLHAVDSLRFIRLMLRGVLLNDKELDFLLLNSVSEYDRMNS